MVTELSGNLIVENGEILLIYRRDQEHWEVPGGKVEENENPTNAAKREAMEEISVDVELKKPFYSGEFQHDGDIFLWHAYLANIKEGKPEIQENKFSKLEWFKGEDLDDIDLAPNLRLILPALRKIS